VGKKLVQFIKWTVTDGQKLSGSLEYAPIPESVAERVLRRLDEITFAN
jgi:hypothetical protein